MSVLMFNCAAVKNWKRSVAWLPELWSETHHGRGTQVFEKNVVMVNCYVSVYYRVTQN